jgi:hypothetical protein
MIGRFVVVAAMGAALAAPLAAQGMQQQAPTGPSVGDMAPDFTAPASNKDGPLKAPVHLADLKGKTVVMLIRRRRHGQKTRSFRFSS